MLIIHHIASINIFYKCLLPARHWWQKGVEETVTRVFGTYHLFSKMTKIESNLALTITIIIFRKIIHYYLHQDHAWIEEVRLSPGLVETLRQITQLIFSAFHSQPLALTPQHFYPGEIRSK